MRVRAIIILALGIAIGLSLAYHSEKVRAFWRDFEENKIMPIIQKLQEKFKTTVYKNERREKNALKNSAFNILTDDALYCNKSVSSLWL